MKNNKPPSGFGRDNVVFDSRWENLRWLVPFIRHGKGTTSNIIHRQGPLILDYIIDEPIAAEEAFESQPSASTIGNREENDDNDGSTISVISSSA